MSVLTTEQIEKTLHVLISHARAKSFVKYKEIAPVLKIHHRSIKFNQALAEVSVESEKRWGVMLTALVVKSWEKRPGDGFYLLMKELRGLNELPTRKDWEKEIDVINERF